jgi:hypothetical protein
METTDKLEMLKEQLEEMTDQVKKMAEALRTPTPCDCCFTLQENADNYLDFENAVLDISNKCQEIHMTANLCYWAVLSVPHEIALAKLQAENREHFYTHPDSNAFISWD